MHKYVWIILGLGLASYATYRLYKASKKRKENSTEQKIKPEVVDSLGMSDVVGYFKGLGLKEGVDKPFIAQGEDVKKGLDLTDPKYDGLEIICLGRHEGPSDEIKDFKALACKEVGNDVKEILGSDKLVVLS